MRRTLQRTLMTEQKEIEQPYFDQCGNEIKEGDLIKIWHFRSYRKTIEYMYQIVLLQESQGKWYWSAKMYYAKEDKGHYWLKSTADEDTRQILSAAVIARDLHKQENDFSILRKSKKKL